MNSSNISNSSDIDSIWANFDIYVYSKNRTVLQDLFQIYLKPLLICGAQLLCFLSVVQLSPLTACKLWKHWQILSQYVALKYIIGGDLLSIAVSLVFWIHKTLHPILTIIGMKFV